MTDLVGGRVQLTLDTISTVLPYIRSGALRALGVGSAQPHPALPGVPTIGESLTGYTILADTPDELAARIARDQKKWRHVIETAGVTL